MRCSINEAPQICRIGRRKHLEPRKTKVLSRNWVVALLANGGAFEDVEKPRFIWVWDLTNMCFSALPCSGQKGSTGLKAPRRPASRIVEMGEPVYCSNVYNSLPNVELYMTGGLCLRPDNVDVEDDTKRSHFEQDINWRIGQDCDEFVIRIARKPEWAARRGQTNVAVRIEGGLSEHPDCSVVFDGGAGSSGHGNGVSSFSVSFKISHEDETFEEEEPEEKEVAFFDHSDHKLRLAPENCYKNVPGASCDACLEPNLQRARWVYRCPEAACDYAVHAACAQFPRTIRHPSHPNHTVKLLKLSPAAAKQCDACNGLIPHGLHYHCAECDFDAHPMCPQPVAENQKSDLEWYRSTHMGMTPHQNLAHTTRLLQQQTQKLLQTCSLDGVPEAYLWPK